MNNHLLVSKDRAEHYFSTPNGGNVDVTLRHNQICTNNHHDFLHDDDCGKDDERAAEFH